MTHTCAWYPSMHAWHARTRGTHGTARTHAWHACMHVWHARAARTHTTHGRNSRKQLYARARAHTHRLQGTRLTQPAWGSSQGSRGGRLRLQLHRAYSSPIAFLVAKVLENLWGTKQRWSVMVDVMRRPVIFDAINTHSMVDDGVFRGLESLVPLIRL